MDKTGEALMAAVIAAPADDLPRLAYADWLDEEGKPLGAEFIRLQLELAAGRERCRAMGERERKLFEILAGDIKDVKYGTWDLWDQDLPARVTGWRDCTLWLDRGGLATYHRGFIADFELPLVKWKRWGQRLVAAHPVEKVELANRRPQRFDRGPGTPALWRWGHGSSAAHRLPLWLASQLEIPAHKGEYQSRELAMDALSRACLAWARRGIPTEHLCSVEKL